MGRVRLSPQQQLEAITRQEKKLSERKAQLLALTAGLRGDSPGVPALFEAIDSVAKLNSISVTKVLMSVAKLKRTGLKFAEPDPTAPKRGPKKKADPGSAGAG
ncbi:MAG: hypothetical protein NT159_07765 [Proteobacteria bacterium]|nr:hypothetical protein [Pseudomonadota bacterium]